VNTKYDYPCSDSPRRTQTRRRIVAAFLFVVVVSAGSAAALAQGTTGGGVALPAVAITGTQESRTLRLSGFYDRQADGIGSFITPENIQREQGRLVGEIVAKYSHVTVRYGGAHAWLATNRSSNDSGCAFCKKRIQDLLDTKH
jgi:hypothetical protein